MTMLNQLIKTEFFTALRTEQELGYIVYSRTDNVHNYPAIGFTVISKEVSLDEINKKVNKFIKDYVHILESTDADAFNQLKSASLEKLSEPPQFIDAEFSPHRADWNSEKLTFDKQDRRRKYITEMTKQDLVKLYQNLVVDQKGYTLTVRVKGKIP